jgi:hypothetical protein
MNFLVMRINYIEIWIKCPEEWAEKIGSGLLLGNSLLYGS